MITEIIDEIEECRQYQMYADSIRLHLLIAKYQRESCSQSTEIDEEEILP